jgi:hypothetical protein
MFTGAKIPADVEQAILRHIGQNVDATAQTIADAVSAETGTPVSRRSVSRILARYRTERADVAKSVLRTELTKTVLSDLDVLQEQRDRLVIMAKASFEEWGRSKKDGAEFRRNSAELREVIAMRLKYSGADEPDAPESALAEASQRLASRLDRLASAGGPGTATSGDRTDPD